MNTETMITELKSVAEKHKNDKLFTFQTNITAMCGDIIPKLEQLAEYEAIGTVEECREAREKQRGRKPYIQSDGHGQTEIDCYECPNCDSFLGYVSDCKDEQYQDSYCRNCGQVIDWSDTP